MAGIFFISDPQTLLGKLRYDLARMEREPWHPFPALDFFVTAYHVLDWIEPGQSEGTKRTRDTFERAHALVAIAGHLATFAKHSRADSKKWDRVRFTYSDYPVTFHARSGRVTGTGPLMVEVTADYASHFEGRTEVPALELARRLLAFWESRLTGRNTTWVARTKDVDG